MSAALNEYNPEFIQGTPEWLALRKTKITATDSCIIMGASHWKTRQQLFKEKNSHDHKSFVTDRMRRGTELEPIARDVYMLKTGIIVYPKVVIKDWAMASLDGLCNRGQHLVEIKCPNDKDHAIALSGKVPEHYYPQLQHQMWVCDLDDMDYFSFDGSDGVIVKVDRDQEYISKMIEEEYKFYQCLINNTPPEPDEGDYIEKDDILWEHCALRLREVLASLKELEKEEQDLRNHLILLSGESNAKGAGISLCQVTRKGNIDYSKVPELRNVDLEVYRKPSSSSWRITCH